MNKDEIMKRLSSFEDYHWIINEGAKPNVVMKEILESMDEEEMVHWIKEAIKLFHDILTSTQK